MDKPVIIFGVNNIGRAAKAMFESNDIVIYGFLDDDKELAGTEIDEVSVLGRTNDDGFLKLIGKKAEAFVASDDNLVRKNLVELLNKKRKVMPVNAIHSSALIDPSSHISHGSFIGMNATIGLQTKIGNHAIVHSGAIIEYGAQLGDFVQIGPGAIIGADVVIEDEVFVGAGANIIGGVTIGKGARIGAGSVVIASVDEGKTVFGNPASEIDS
jgi:sugar O-acyltransferase (sialic acid O-acetyltransferase NeuD family)